MPGRTYTAANGYRYGFNGKEKDDEAKGNGNSLDFGARIYDGRLGRWLSTDAQEHLYPMQSPYNFVLNNPVLYIDKDGEKVYLIIYDEGHVNFTASALTRQREIEGSVTFDRKNDHVYIVKMTDLGILKQTMENINKDASKNGYGNTTGLYFYSHGGATNGPVGDEVKDKSQSLQAQTKSEFDRGQLTDDAWAGINFNFDPKQSIAVFNSCNGESFAQKFIGLQPSLEYAAGISGKAAGTYNLCDCQKPSGIWASENDQMYMAPYYYDNNEGGAIINGNMVIYSRQRDADGFPAEVPNSNIIANPYVTDDGKIRGKGVTPDCKVNDQPIKSSHN